MPETFYNNPAGRLLRVLQEVSKASPQSLANVADGLGVPAEWDKVLQAVQDLHSEYRLLELCIENFRHISPNKYAIYKEDLPAIFAAIRGFVLNLQTNGLGIGINDKALVALRYMAAELDVEKIAPREELNTGPTRA